GLRVALLYGFFQGREGLVDLFHRCVDGCPAVVRKRRRTGLIGVFESGERLIILTQSTQGRAQTQPNARWRVFGTRELFVELGGLGPVFGVVGRASGCREGGAAWNCLLRDDSWRSDDKREHHQENESSFHGFSISEAL